MGCKGIEEIEEDKEKSLRHERKRIEKAIARVNTTPSRVEISGSTAVPTVIIHRIPLILHAKDLLGRGWFRLIGFMLCLILIPIGFWIGIPMVLMLLHGISLLRFVIRFRRPIRIRINAGTFYLDFWNGEQYKGKVSKNPLELDFRDRFIKDGWVELGITPGWFYKAPRGAFRLKLDDALKLIAFGKANKLDVSVSNEISRLKKKFEQPREQ